MRSEQDRPPRPTTPPARALPTAWAFWLLMTAGGLYLAVEGRALPYTDDLLIADAVSGERPIRLSWLWAQWNDHRIPIVKAVLVPLYRAASYDCRSALLLNVALLALASALMIRTAAAIRGGPSHADAFFPLAFLGWWSSSLAWGFQFQFVASVTLATVILGAIATRSGRAPARSATVVGVSLLCLPLCGANGLGLVPALAAWAAVAGYFALRSPGGRERTGGIILAASAAMAAMLVLLYYRDYHRSQSLTTFRPGPAGLAESLAMMTSSGLGAPASLVGYLGSPGLANGLRLAFTALVGSGGVLAVAMTLGGGRRREGSALIAVLAGQMCLFAGIAYGRAEGFLLIWSGQYRSPVPGVNAAIHQTDSYYSILAVPALCAAYLSFVLAGRQGWRRVRLIPGVLAVLMGIAAIVAVPSRLVDLHRYHASEAAFLRDVRGGLAPESIVARHYPLLFCATVSHDIVPAIRAARAAKLGVFGEIRPDTKGTRPRERDPR